MKNSSTRTLPPEYQLIRRLDIREKKSLLLINLLGVILLILSWFGFTRLAYLIRPDNQNISFAFSSSNIVSMLIDLGIFFLVIILMLVVHEGLHGICFWIFTKSRPRFAFKGYYAYAAAPDWYLPKGDYLITGLAPLVGITLICVTLMFFVPAAWLMPLIWMLVFNTSGACGDLWMVFELLRSPADVLARDQGDVLEFFAIVNQE